MATFDYSQYSIDKNQNPTTGGQNIYKNGVVQDYKTMLPLFQSGFDTSQIKNFNQSTTGLPTMPTVSPARYLAVPHNSNPGAYNDIYNPQGQLINQQQFQQLGLNVSQIPAGSMQDVQKAQLAASGLPQDQQGKISEIQNLWNTFNQQTPEQKAQQESLQTSLDKLIALQGQLSTINAPSDQIAALDKTIQEQQNALKSLNPVDYLNTQQGLKDVGISQAQLDRTIAMQRDPIARGLSDLLNSRSILGQQYQAQQQAVQNQIQGQQQIFNLQKAMMDLTPSNKMPDSAFNTLFSNILAPKQQPQPTASIQEYEYAVKNGYKGSFTQYQNEDANRKSPAGTSGTTPIDIQAGSKEYKIAQDLAYGALTFKDFRTLYAYSRNVDAKTSIYQKASELNPNFNPAAFELGYAVASNPRIRQQVSALDNVNQRAQDLIKMSDSATRSGITTLNKIIEKGGIILGGRKYSNFHTAQIAFADELSGALGFGSATDMSRQMGFNMTDETLTPEQFSSAINTVVLPFIESKRSTLINQMGVYGSNVNNFSQGNPSGTSSKDTNNATDTSTIESDIKQAIHDTINFKNREDLISALVQHYGINQQEAATKVYTIWKDNAQR